MARMSKLDTLRHKKLITDDEYWAQVRAQQKAKKYKAKGLAGGKAKTDMARENRKLRVAEKKIVDTLVPETPKPATLPFTTRQYYYSWLKRLPLLAHPQRTGKNRRLLNRNVNKMRFLVNKALFELTGRWLSMDMAGALWAYLHALDVVEMVEALGEDREHLTEHSYLFEYPFYPVFDLRFVQLHPAARNFQDYFMGRGPMSLEYQFLSVTDLYRLMAQMGAKQAHIRRLVWLGHKFFKGSTRTNAYFEVALGDRIVKLALIKDYDRSTPARTAGGYLEAIRWHVKRNRKLKRLTASRGVISAAGSYRTASGEYSRYGFYRDRARAIRIAGDAEVVVPKFDLRAVTGAYAGRMPEDELQPIPSIDRKYKLDAARREAGQAAVEIGGCDGALAGQAGGQGHEAQGDECGVPASGDQCDDQQGRGVAGVFDSAVQA